MSSTSFRNINRAFRRGHITLIPNAAGFGTSIFRRTKSHKVGAGSHNPWPKDMHLFYRDGAYLRATREMPQKWTRVQ